MADDETEKGFKGSRLTALEKQGRKRNPTHADWRRKLQMSKVSFDDVKKGIYLHHLAKYGRKMHAAAAAGVCVETVARHIENDPEFAAARQEALDNYRDNIQALAVRLMEGVKKPIVGGPDKDQIVAHEIVHATNLLAMEMRKTNPEYKERQEIDLNAGGGVMIAPPGISAEDFAKQEEARNADKTEPGADERAD